MALIKFFLGLVKAGLLLALLMAAWSRAGYAQTTDRFSSGRIEVRLCPARCVVVQGHGFKAGAPVRALERRAGWVRVSNYLDRAKLVASFGNDLPAKPALWVPARAIVSAKAATSQNESARESARQRKPAATRQRRQRRLVSLPKFRPGGVIADASQTAPAADAGEASTELKPPAQSKREYDARLAELRKSYKAKVDEASGIRDEAVKQAQDRFKALVDQEKAQLQSGIAAAAQRFRQETAAWRAEIAKKREAEQQAAEQRAAEEKAAREAEAARVANEAAQKAEAEARAKEQKAEAEAKAKEEQEARAKAEAEAQANAESALQAKQAEAAKAAEAAAKEEAQNTKDASSVSAAVESSGGKAPDKPAGVVFTPPTAEPLVEAATSETAPDGGEQERPAISFTTQDADPISFGARPKSVTKALLDKRLAKLPGPKSKVRKEIVIALRHYALGLLTNKECSGIAGGGPSTTPGMLFVRCTDDPTYLRQFPLEEESW